MNSWHYGRWNLSKITLSYSVGGTSGSGESLGSETCDTWGFLACQKKKLNSTYQINVPVCGKHIAANATHLAWWLGTFNITIGIVGFETGRYGEKQVGSVAPENDLQPCNDGDGDGGGGGGEDDCFSVWLVWRDEFGNIESDEFLYNMCCGNDGCYEI